MMLPICFYFFYLCRNLFIRRRLLIAAEVELFSVSLGHHRGYLTETISKMKRNENVILIMNRIKYELTGGGRGREGGTEGGETRKITLEFEIEIL